MRGSVTQATLRQLGVRSAGVQSGSPSRLLLVLGGKLGCALLCHAPSLLPLLIEHC